MLLPLHKTLKGNRNIQGFALIRAVLFEFVAFKNWHIGTINAQYISCSYRISGDFRLRICSQLIRGKLFSPFITLLYKIYIVLHIT